MSFTSETKIALAAAIPEKECCRRAMLAGMLLFSTRTMEKTLLFKTESEEVSTAFTSLIYQTAHITLETKKAGKIYVTELSEDAHSTLTFQFGFEKKLIHDFLQCPKCDESFFRGAFLATGFVSPPDKSGRIELSTADADLACNAAAILTKHFRLPKLSVRRGDQIIYYRDMESIEYFLSYIGAKKAAFDIFNAQMYREKSNEVNRKQNCDLANLSKTVNSSAQHREAISALMESGEIEKLPSELRRTAELRMQHDTMSLSELAAMEDPPISKSQVSKRLKKIYDFYIERTTETT